MATSMLIGKTKPVTCMMHVRPSSEQHEILLKAKTTLQCSAKSFCLQLESEMFVLNRVLYMKHGQLRREKSFRGLKQIRACLRKFCVVGLEFEKLLKELGADFESSILQIGVRTQLPSRQMWQHFLTRILAVAALLTNTASRCVTVFLHVHRHLGTGNLISTNTMFLSLLSRIWASCHALCNNLQTWYLDLLPVTDVLTPSDVPWLPPGTELPQELSTWLKDQGLNAGVMPIERQAADGDLAALKAIEVEKEGVTMDISLPVGMDTSLPVAMDTSLLISTDESMAVTTNSHTSIHPTSEDDFGAPVRRSEMGLEPNQSVEKAVECAEGRKVTNLLKKVRRAESFADLHRLLKFSNKFLGPGKIKKLTKIQIFLSELESKAQVFEVRGNEKRVQKLLFRGKKKVLKFVRASAGNEKKASEHVTKGRSNKT